MAIETRYTGGSQNHASAGAGEPSTSSPAASPRRFPLALTTMPARSAAAAGEAESDGGCDGHGPVGERCKTCHALTVSLSEG